MWVEIDVVFNPITVWALVRFGKIRAVEVHSKPDFQKAWRNEFFASASSFMEKMKGISVHLPSKASMALILATDLINPSLSLVLYLHFDI